MHLVKSVVFQARERLADPAIAFPGGVATYGALMKSTEAAIEALAIFNLGQGAMVMLDIRNPVYHTAMIFALALMGLPSASVGTGFVVEKAGVLPKLFLTDREDVSIAGVRVIRVDDRWFASAPNRDADLGKLQAMPGFTDPDAIVRYVYSSGTTGHPKCVALTVRCLEDRIHQAVRASTWSSQGPAMLNMMGFSTIAGIMAPLIAHLGGNLLCYAGNSAEALQLTRLFRVASLAVSVGQLQSLLNELGDNPPLTSLRRVSVAGAKLTPRLLAETRARICSNVWVAYGSTEIGTLSNGAADATDHHPGSAGFIVPGAELQAVDEAGNSVAAGQEGVFRARAPHAAFYVDAEGKPVDLYTEGWFYPGDVGVIDAEGRVTVTGRTNEVMNRGGVIVAPEVIEDVLRLDRRLLDVAVVGLPGPAGTEEIWAAVVSAETIDPAAMIQAARPKLNEKVPDRIVQLDSIPRNVNSKVQRNLLRETLLKHRG